MDFYNHTAKLFSNGDVNIANLKVMLVNAYAFVATETVLTAVNAAEVSGFGWAVGGEVITGAAVTITTTNDSTLDGDNISVTATGGDIGPADALVVVDGTNLTPLFHFGFISPQTAPDTTPFNVNWNAAGITNWNVA
jgi:hypothetical protein